MSENIVFAILFFPAAAAVLIFFMRYLSEMLQAKARLSQDAAYREVALKVVTAQSETAMALTSLTAELAEIKSRFSALEKILKDVE